MTIYAPFIDGAGLSWAPTFAHDKTHNLYLENRGTEGAKTEKALYGMQGLRLFKDFADAGPIRGQLSIAGYDFVVSAGNVYQKSVTDVWSLLGTVANDGLPVKWVADSTQLFLRSAGFGYKVAAGTVTPVPTPPWTTLIDIEFIDDYFVGLDDNGAIAGGQFFISSPNDCLTWDPIDFGTVPANSDKLRALKVNSGKLIVFGSVICQPFYNSGDPDFPFAPDQSGTMNIGTIAKNSICSVVPNDSTLADTVFFLSESGNGDGQVVKLVGFTPTRVSTNAIETLIQSLRQTVNPTGWAIDNNTIGWTFQDKGHQFYQLNFPETNVSLRYDSTTNRWFSCGWYNKATDKQEAHRGVNHVYDLTRHLVGDREKSIIWEMDSDFYTDKDPDDPDIDVPIIAYREVLLPSDGTTRMYLNRAELLAETGVGDNDPSSPGYDPTVEIAVSDDGGRTFGDLEYARLGKLGEYDTKVEWARLGSGEQLAVRVQCSAPVKRAWYGLDVRMVEAKQ